MKFTEDDGGREAAGYKGTTGDCVTRAIAIADQTPYREVYDALAAGIAEFAKGRSRAARQAASGGGRRGTTPRNGVHREVYQKYLEARGWRWVPTMRIGQGCQVHLTEGELPKGRLIVSVSKHLCAVVDGVIHDTHDPQRGGTRCVYGYYVKDGQAPKPVAAAPDPAAVETPAPEKPPKWTWNGRVHVGVLDERAGGSVGSYRATLRRGDFTFTRLKFEGVTAAEARRLARATLAGLNRKPKKRRKAKAR